MKDNEGCAVARRESWGRIDDTILGTRSLARVSGQEVVLCLGTRKLTYRRQDTVSIAGEHDNVDRVRISNAWDLGIRNVFDWVSAAGVLGRGDVVVVGESVSGVVDDVLKDRTKSDGVVDFGFLKMLSAKFSRTPGGRGMNDAPFPRKG